MSWMPALPQVIIDCLDAVGDEERARTVSLTVVPHFSRACLDEYEHEQAEARRETRGRAGNAHAGRLGGLRRFYNLISYQNPLQSG